MLMKLILTTLVCIAIALLIQTYQPVWFTQIAFKAPFLGAMSYAACGIAFVFAVCMAKLSFGKH